MIKEATFPRNLKVLSVEVIRSISSIFTPVQWFTNSLAEISKMSKMFLNFSFGLTKLERKNSVLRIPPNLAKIELLTQVTVEEYSWTYSVIQF